MTASTDKAASGSMTGHFPRRPKDPLIFLHLQKIGGNAVKRYVEIAFLPDQAITPLADNQEARVSLARYAGMSDVERQRLKVIFGHSAKLFRSFLPKAPVVAILRDPFDRAMSQYVYERRNAEALGFREEDRPLPHEIPLGEFMRRFLHWGTWRLNFSLQTRSIADFLDVDLSDVSVDNVAGLADRFDFLGVQNEFALSLFLLSRRYGFPAKAVPFVNSCSPLVKQFFPRSFVEEVYAASALDMRLFQVANQRVEAEAVDRLSTPSEWEHWNAHRAETDREIKRHVASAEVQYVSAEVPSNEAVQISDGGEAVLMAISLPAGTWDVSGMVAFTGDSGTLVKYLVASMSSLPGSIDGHPGRRADAFYSATKSVPIFGSGNFPSLSFPPIRVTPTESMTIYLVVLAEFAEGAVSAFGTISARRAR